eukprot:365253-Chlamydomonas_euryale.AAC.3
MACLTALELGSAWQIAHGQQTWDSGRPAAIHEIDQGRSITKATFPALHNLVVNTQHKYYI